MSLQHALHAASLANTNKRGKTLLQHRKRCKPLALTHNFGRFPWSVRKRTLSRCPGIVPQDRPFCPGQCAYKSASWGFSGDPATVTPRLKSLPARKLNQIEMRRSRPVVWCWAVGTFVSAAKASSHSKFTGSRAHQSHKMGKCLCVVYAASRTFCSSRSQFALCLATTGPDSCPADRSTFWRETRSFRHQSRDFFSSKLRRIFLRSCGNTWKRRRRRLNGWSQISTLSSIRRLYTTRTWTVHMFPQNTKPIHYLTHYRYFLT